MAPSALHSWRFDSQFVAFFVWLRRGETVCFSQLNRYGLRLNEERLMSQHRSLKGASTIQTKRNVLKRFERVELLKKRGQFKPGDRVIGLPKTKPEV